MTQPTSRTDCLGSGHPDCRGPAAPHRSSPCRPSWFTATLLAATLCSGTATNDVSTIRDLSDAALHANTFPFPSVIHTTTGYRVISLDTNNPDHVELCRQLVKAAALATSQAQRNPIQAARPNEAGNRIESYVKEALEQSGLTARTPHTSEGGARAVGYPDVELPGEPHCYLEIKTYSASAATSSQRTFYYSPSATPKVTHDALHLLLAFRLEKEVGNNKTVFTPSHWQLLSLESLEVKMKLEFNQSNRGLYGSNAGPRFIGQSESCNKDAAHENSQ